MKTKTKAPKAAKVEAAPKAAKVEAAPKAAKVEAARKATPASKLTWLVAANPKRNPSASYQRAAAYWGAKTVADYLQHGTRADLNWDADHGFLTVAV